MYRVQTEDFSTKKCWFLAVSNCNSTTKVLSFNFLVTWSLFRLGVSAGALCTGTKMHVTPGPCNEYVHSRQTCFVSKYLFMVLYAVRGSSARRL